MARIRPATRLAAAIALIMGAGTVAPPGLPGAGYTATHYVAPFAEVSGATSDEDAQNATAYANATSISTPCTFQCAMKNAVAPHRVECAPGVLDAEVQYGGSEVRFIPAWFPTNEGTSHENNIVFFCKYPAADNPNSPELWTELRRAATFPETGTFNPITGASVSDAQGRDYVYWDGFFIDESVSPGGASGGCVMTQGGSIGIRYRRFLIHTYDLPEQYPTGWNGNVFWSQGCDDVRYQDIMSLGDDSLIGSANDSLIQAYGSQNMIVEHCTGIGRGGLVYFKASTNANCMGRYCWSEANGSGSTQNYGTQISESTIFHHCYGKAQRQVLVYFNPADSSEVNVKSHHMTIVCTGGNFDTAIYMRACDRSLQEDQLYDSIVICSGSNGSKFAELGDGNDPTIGDFDRFNHNVYYRLDAHTPRWGVHATDYTSFAAYQAQMASYGTDPYGDAYESDSIYADPEFTDFDNDDFTLQAGSPALTAGVGGGICGAFDGTGHVGKRPTVAYLLGDVA